MSDTGPPRPTTEEQPVERIADGGTTPFEALADADTTDALDPSLRGSLDVPSGRPVQVIDVRRAGPPTPLTRTLETLEDCGDDVVLLQRNDRLPSHLFSRLDDRGYRHGAVERDDEVLTAVWRD